MTAALILAGSRGGPDPVAAVAGVSHKALAIVAGQTILARVVAALREAGIARILVSASDPAVAAEARALGAETVAAEAGPSASALAGLVVAGAPLIVTTADHALLRAQWVRDFLAAVPADADVAACLARREAIERDAPPTRRTYLRFADGAWSGCNLFLLATPAARNALDLWAMVERDRKRPWRIVRRLGAGMLLRYLLGRLTLAEAVSRLGMRAGVRASVVPARSGLAAVDVDTPADLALVRNLVRDLAETRDRAPGAASP